MLQLPVYLDYNATTPCDPRVVEAMLPYFSQHFGNAASRSHSFGWIAEEAVEYAREQVAKLIGAGAKEIVFTSGATEANNLALKGVFEAYGAKGRHIITVATEHKAVLDSCKHLEKLGAEITYLGVDKTGLIDPSDLEAAMRPDTILVAVMYANNETGVIHPVAGLSSIARKYGALFFCDAVQAAGKIPLDVDRNGIDLLSMSAHKMYGPKGVGALYVRRRNPRVKIAPQIDGGGHEKGLRSGTLNVPGIAGFGKAAEIAFGEMNEDQQRISKLRDKLESALLKIKDVMVNGDTHRRLANVSNLSFRYVEGHGLMLGCNKDIAISSGSACSSASIEPSHVLKAMGLDDEAAHSSIRFSLGRFTSEEEIDFVIDQISRNVLKLRDLNPLSQQGEAATAHPEIQQ